VRGPADHVGAAATGQVVGIFEVSAELGDGPVGLGRALGMTEPAATPALSAAPDCV
jgi:hypothetical protein